MKGFEIIHESFLKDIKIYCRWKFDLNFIIYYSSAYHEGDNAPLFGKYFESL